MQRPEQVLHLPAGGVRIRANLLRSVTKPKEIEEEHRGVHEAGPAGTGVLKCRERARVMRHLD